MRQAPNSFKSKMTLSNRVRNTKYINSPGSGERTWDWKRLQRPARVRVAPTPQGCSSTLKGLVGDQPRLFHKVFQSLLSPGDPPISSSIKYFPMTKLSYDLALPSLSARALVLKSQARSGTVSELQAQGSRLDQTRVQLVLSDKLH